MLGLLKKLPNNKIFIGAAAQLGYNLLIREVSRSHTTTHHSR